MKSLSPEVKEQKLFRTQIASAYRPLTNLMARRQIKLSTCLKIEQLLNFILSEHAGFRCASLFLVRKDITMEVGACDCSTQTGEI